MNESGWITPRCQPVLQANEVHVWKASLEASRSGLANIATMLSPNELERADTYRFPDDRRRFVIARGTLRAILARYLAAEPRDLQFAYSVNGKPELRADSRPTLHFSVSHSHDRALFAVARCEVGVDIEKIRPDLPVHSIAQMFFSSQEQASLDSVSDIVKRKSFFTCWCRKEAVLKALGGGLAVGLDQFTVAVIPGEPAKLLSTQDRAIDIRDWSLIDLAVGDEYAGAVAVKTTAPILKCWDASALLETRRHSLGKRYRTTRC